MGRRTIRSAARRPSTAAEGVVHDTTWAGEARSAVGCALLLLGLLLAVDTGAATLTNGRAAVWAALALLLFAVLWPVQVSVSRGRLVTRGLLGRTEVRTDRLVSVRTSAGVAQRLVLRDADGNRAEIDPRVLIANPAMWHVLDTDARTSADRGTLRCGEPALRRIAARLDKETARTVFKLSGLK
ncbi:MULTISPECIES: hypothetical protein [unclassified Streptomyces]|uniref:hypothetical protein n=1 Tax=unclassified Streptomyces TaxID=2593676 RepID=UPI003808CF33